MLQGLVYDYVFDSPSGSWVSWNDELNERMQSFAIPYDAKFQEILVPTIDTLRYTHLLDLLIKNETPVLFVGPTGNELQLMFPS